jgi:hypothetical protein
MVCSVQTVHLSCTDTNTIYKYTKTRFHMTHVTYEFYQVRPKLFMSLWYILCKSCTYLVSRLALSPNGANRAPPDPYHQGVPRARLKWFMSLWYVWRKTRTYRAPMLTLSQNRSKRYSTWPTSPRSSIRCLQYYFWSYGTFDTNHPPILHQGSTISKWTEPSFHLSLITYESHRVRLKWFQCLWYVRCTPCTYLALTLHCLQMD